MMMSLCESCARVPYQVCCGDNKPEDVHITMDDWDVDEDDSGHASLPPYQLCGLCALRLINHALREAEWFRLVKRHGARDFLLRNAFYNSSYDAWAGEVDDSTPELPNTEVLNNEILELIAYALCCVPVPDEVLTALKQHPLNTVLETLAPFITFDNPDIDLNIRSRSLILYARIGGEAACHFITSELAKIPATDIHHHHEALTYLNSPAVIEWLETRISSPIYDSFGKIVAANAVIWSDIDRWLQKGRPLSLVALDALKFCRTPDYIEPGEIKYFLREPDPQATMTDVITQYLDQDNSVRVKKVCAEIIQHWDDICSASHKPKE
jgi:hypothetical protein